MRVSGQKSFKYEAVTDHRPYSAMLVEYAIWVPLSFHLSTATASAGHLIDNISTTWPGIKKVFINPGVLLGYHSCLLFCSLFASVVVSV